MLDCFRKVLIGSTQSAFARGRFFIALLLIEKIEKSFLFSGPDCFRKVLIGSTQSAFARGRFFISHDSFLSKTNHAPSPVTQSLLYKCERMCYSALVL
jgi:hypothetical protein